MIIDGHKLAETMYADLRRRVKRLQRRGVTPRLGVVLVGDHAPSQVYVGRKQEAAQALGMECRVTRLPASATTEQVMRTIKRIQQPRFGLHGLIVQLPLPRQIDMPQVLSVIKPALDVDVLTADSLGRLVRGTQVFVPPTPAAILFILERYRIKLAGRHVVVVGAGELVGKPLVNLLFQHQATVSVLNQATPDLVQFTRSADIVISGVGKPGLITGPMIKRGAVVIDAGTAAVGDIMMGDVDLTTVAPKARLVTPTPGGVGPLTVAHLLQNTVLATELQSR